MKTFSCYNCGQLLFFENVSCLQCGYTLGYAPNAGSLEAIEAAGNDMWRPLNPARAETLYRLCQNYQLESACNWLAPVSDNQLFCVSCRLNQTIPTLARPGNREAWLQLEQAKRRLVYSLLVLNLPLAGEESRSVPNLAFAFLESTPDKQVFTGHKNGLITINIAEADDAERERIRQQMNEPYRTLLGHFRHESGHYYWLRLVAGTDWLAPFRALFGDEQQPYQAALEEHYQEQASGWSNKFVSRYAATHPWEDWAETWAHYLHILDTLETARDFSLSATVQSTPIRTLPDYATIHRRPFEEILDSWIPLTAVLNSLNRSMGLKDAYPFVLPPDVVKKLSFIHRLVHRLPA